MKRSSKNSIVKLTVLVFTLVLGFTSPIAVNAATSPTLVGAANFSVLGATTVTCTGATVVTGDVGVAAGSAITGFPVPCTVSPGSQQPNTASAIAAQADNLTAFGFLDAGANASGNCINPLTLLAGSAPDGTDLTGLTLAPGLYCSAGSFLLTNGVGTDLTLTGAGPWVFKTVSALTTSPGSSVVVATGSACDVWWRVGSSAILDTTTSFVGNILALTDIDLLTGASLIGRAMAQTAAVDLDANSISGCVNVALLTGGSPGIQSLQTPLPVPPLIDLVKVPNPLSLPLGPGPVVYTYTLRNIGTVPVADVIMTDDSCSPINLISGDTNSDSKLDTTETWIYRCGTTLSATHTNTVTVIGWANGISAVDLASATVVVGVPIVPPLIHVTKIPAPLSLSAAGGFVTYTNIVTNPGTVALSNIRLADDRCSPVQYASGDVNRDSKLDTTEAWTYTCRTNLTGTTTNTITAQGDANGLTARDFAVATVVVAAPSLPRTGFPLENPWNKIVPIGIFVVLLFVYLFRKEKIV
jgi:hypothetical protein